MFCYVQHQNQVGDIVVSLNTVIYMNYYYCLNHLYIYVYLKYFLLKHCDIHM